MKVKKTPIAAAATLSLLAATFAAQAQQADGQQPQQLDQVVVTGIRASLQTAVNIKKNADAIVDAISAEDIGKLPDSDVGETLGRIPGISVDREFGQGALVSIRGTDPQMTYTTLNGQTVASTGWYDQQSIDRSFNYSLLPSELIGGMDVYKTSQADLTEGGIGGTVIVKTRKPLDLPSMTAFASAHVGKGTVSTSPDKDASGLFSWHDDRKMFGALIAGAIEDGIYVRRGVESDTRWSGDVEPTTFIQDRKRTALNVALQARPAAGVDLGLNYMNLVLNADNSNTSQYLFQGGAPGTGGSACTSVNASGVCVTSNTAAPGATPMADFMQTWARTAKMTSDSLTLNGSYKTDGLKLEAVLGTTKAGGGTSETTNYSYDNGFAAPFVASLPNWAGQINATSHQIRIYPSSSQAVTLAMLPANEGPQGSWATNKGPNSDKENYAQVDATFDLNWGALTSFKTGVRATEHTFTKNTIGAVMAAADAGTPITVPTASLYDGSMPMGTPGWSVPKPNIGAMMANTNQNVTAWIVNRSGYGQIKENNSAVYGMFTFEKDQLHGNFGLRFVQTDVTSTGYDFDGTPLAAGDLGANAGWDTKMISQKSTYHDLLPSANVVYDLEKDTLLRFAASTAITRPNFDNMFLASEAGFDQNPGNQTLTYGSAALKPFKSNQFDLSLEHYYGHGNLVSIGYFHKSINNFITTVTALNQPIGVVSTYQGVSADSWTVNRYINAGGGKIDGLEAQISHAFGNGFGVIANYTYEDARAPASSYSDNTTAFTQSSRDNLNFVGYWENAVYSARIAYNWRSAYMMRETGWYGDRMHGDYGTLDLSLGWNITPALRLSFDAANLLKANNLQYGIASSTDQNVKVPLQSGYPAWSFMGETTYRIGLSAKF